MIETLTAPLDQFDLTGVIEAYRTFYRHWAGDVSDPDASVTAMKSLDTTPKPLCEDRDLVEDLVERGWKLFFQMHQPLANG
jgi:hypothetical protein